MKQMMMKKIEKVMQRKMKIESAEEKNLSLTNEMELTVSKH